MALETIQPADGVLTTAHWAISWCLLKVCGENMSGAKCLITTGPHSISVLLLFMTKSPMYRRHIYYPHEEHICAAWQLKCGQSGKPRRPILLSTCLASLSFISTLSKRLGCTAQNISPQERISPSSICLSRRGEFFIRTDRWALICVTPPRARVPRGVGAAANEATIPSRVYGAWGMLIRCIRSSRRISQPSRRTTWANRFWVCVWHHS